MGVGRGTGRAMGMGTAANLFISPLMHNNAQCQGQKITRLLGGILTRLAAKCDLCAGDGGTAYAEILNYGTRLDFLDSQCRILAATHPSIEPLKLICASALELLLTFLHKARRINHICPLLRAIRVRFYLYESLSHCMSPRSIPTFILIYFGFRLKVLPHC